MEQLEECLERIQYMQQLLPGQNDPVTPLVECFRSLTPAWPATDPCVFLETLLQHADGLTSLHADKYPDLIVRLVLCTGLKQEEARRILVQSFRILFPAKGSEPTNASPEHVHMFVNRMLHFRDELELTRAVLSDCLPRVIVFKNSKKVMFKKLVEIAHFTEFQSIQIPQPGTVHAMDEKTRRNAIAAGFETIDAEVDAAFPNFNYAEHYRRRHVVVGLTDDTQQASFDKPWPAYYALAESPGASKAADDAPRLLDTLDRDECTDGTSVLKYIPPQLQKFKEDDEDAVKQSFMQAKTKHPYKQFVHTTPKTTFTFTVEVKEDNDWKEMQDVRDIEPRGVGQWSVRGAYLKCNRDIVYGNIVYDAGKRSGEWRVQYTMQTSRGVVAAEPPVAWEGEVTALGNVRENKPDGCGFIFQLQPTYYFQRAMDKSAASTRPVLSRAPLRVKQPKGLDNTFWSRMVSKTGGPMQALCLQRKVKPFGALDGATNCCLRWGMVENISGKKFRPAQTEALNRVFPGDKIISPPNTPEMIDDKSERVLRSGTLVLPCGAGKTLIGVCAAMRVQGRVLIVVPNQSLVSQWIRELEYNALVRAGRYGSGADVIVCTQGKLDVNIVKPKKTTVQTMKMTRPKTIAADFKMKTTVWDLIIIDESHLSIPINERILGALVYKSAICLSATVLHKQPDKQLYTRHMPPVIFETTWPVIHSDVILYPIDGGSISSADIVKKASKFFDFNVFKDTKSDASSAGSSTASVAGRRDSSNQNKASVSFFATVQNIINHVLKQHHRKVLVFSDVIDIWAACLAYCAMNNDNNTIYPYANGKTPEEDRFNMYNAFQTDADSRVLFVTKIADVGIDLTKCTDVIIIAGSGMTADAQRFGRALRGVENPHAIRRTLHEVYMEHQTTDLAKRLRFLTARGFRPMSPSALVQKDDRAKASSQNSPLLPTHAWTDPSASAAAASKSSTSAETASPLLDSHAWSVHA